MVATAAPPRRQRRVKLKSNSSTVGEYRYDALGRRVEKVVTGATYRYIYSGVETVSVYTTTGTWKQDYVYGPGIDEVLMLEQADVLDADGDSNTSETARSWYLTNALGSVMEVLEQDKTEAVSYRYDPYGNITIMRGGSSQSSDPLGQYVTYTGRWRDEEAGLYYYRARAYDSARGRFVQRDPAGLQIGPNLYVYAQSSPIKSIDPTGLSSIYDRDTKQGIVFVIGAFLLAGPSAMKAADKAADEASDDARKESARGFDENAVRHCLWMCYTAINIRQLDPKVSVLEAATRAYTIGKAFEYAYNNNGRFLDAESEVDLGNNTVGTQCAMVAKSKKDCLDCCLESHADGSLVILGSSMRDSLYERCRRRDAVHR